MTDFDFKTRLEEAQGRIAAACERVGRSPDEVTLLPVSKGFGPEHIRVAAENGLTVFGENKVQEAGQKIPLCPGHLEWHMIGHLQRNKVRRAIGIFSVIHSVDSLPLLQSINSACDEFGKTMPICIQVNISGEGSKHGFGIDEVPEALAVANELLRVEAVGLMTMPPFVENPEEVRPCLRSLRELRDEAAKQTGSCLKELSMGMSHDFEVAIEEGATYVRIGSLLFGQRGAH